MSESEEPPAAATALAGALEILVPMAGLIDKQAEIARLNKEIEKLDKEVARLTGKLNNANFVDKAPADVVAKEREKVLKQQQSLATLQEQLLRIQNI